MCKVLGVSRSGYYNWLKRQQEGPTKTQKRRKELKKKITQLFHENLGTYGAPRLHKALLADDYKVSEKTVGRYMRQLGLRAIPEKPYTATTDSDHNDPIFDDLLQQDFEVEKPNQVWVSDITYVWTTEGWVYLAIVLDLYARKVVGWHAADNMRKDLPLNALKMAVALRQPGKDLIHHSDRGSQYASNDYTDELLAIDALGSMSRKGNPYDNACAETFFATLKKEYIYRRTFSTRDEVIKGINWYISSFYNERRRHSHNDYLSPNQYERGEFEKDSESLDSYLLAG